MIAELTPPLKETEYDRGIGLLPPDYEKKARDYDSDEVPMTDAAIDISVRLGLADGTAWYIVNARRNGAISVGEYKKYFRQRQKEEKFPEYLQRVERETFYNGTLRLKKIKANKVEESDNIDTEVRRAQENQEMLELLLEELNPRDKEVIKMMFYEGMGAKEVAQKIERSRILVYKIIEKSFRIMRERMKDFGYSLRRGFEN